MRISELNKTLREVNSLSVFTPDGLQVPQHFHITEAGLTTKHFIDCGGTIRLEKVVSMQLWVANDTDHRLSPVKLAGILKKAEPLFMQEDLEVEIEYQANTIGRFGLEYADGKFQLTTKATNCLAQDHCGIPSSQMPEFEPAFSLVETGAATCKPGGGCC
jgi:hypothetical protein